MARNACPSLVQIALLAALALMPTGAQAASEAGVIAGVIPAAQSEGRRVTLGARVVMGQRFQTDAGGALHLTLADGSAFHIGPNSDLEIDRFIYDPDKGTAELAASSTRGVFRFIGGAASKTGDGVTITTPVGTAGIRGAIAWFAALPPGSSGRDGDQSLPGSGWGLAMGLEYGTELRFVRPDGAAFEITEAGGALLFRPGGGDPIPLEPDQIAAALRASMPGGGGPEAALGGASPDAPAGISAPDIPPLLPGLSDEEGLAALLETLLDMMQEDLAQDLIDSGSGTIVEPPGGGATLSGERIGFAQGIRPSDYAHMNGTLRLEFDPELQSLSGYLSGNQAGFPELNFGDPESYYLADDDFGVTSGQLRLNRSSDTLCACPWLQWGEWAETVNSGPNEGPAPTDTRGYWITGALTEQTDLPMSGSASYTGRAIGHLRTGSDITAAEGAFTASVDFGSGESHLQVQNFGGVSFHSSDTFNLQNATESDGTFFTPGVNTDTNTELSGGFYGGFISDGSDPVAGMIGQFNLTDNSDDWQASGIFAGR